MTNHDKTPDAAAVKPLEWRAIDGSYCVAAALFGGMYSIQYYRGMAVPAKLRTHGWPDGLEGMFKTVDEAKAAAQADYEKRILSALEGAKP